MENLEDEIWKDIKGFESYYQVSNLGRVKSLERLVDNLKYGKMNVKERVLKQGNVGNGYLMVILTKNSKKSNRKVHQLVSEAFLNHNPDGYRVVVNHKDFNRKNNRLKNLELISTRQNTNLKHIPHSSQYTGVSWNKKHKKWYAFIYFNNKHLNLGGFDNEYEAHLTYEAKIKEISKFTKINRICTGKKKFKTLINH